MSFDVGLGLRGIEMSRVGAQLRSTLQGLALALLLLAPAHAEKPELWPGHPSREPLQAPATNPNAPLIQRNVINTSGPIQAARITR